MVRPGRLPVLGLAATGTAVDQGAGAPRGVERVGGLDVQFYQFIPSRIRFMNIDFASSTQRLDFTRLYFISNDSQIVNCMHTLRSPWVPSAGRSRRA